MNILITAASKHGATRELAETIARVLEEHGLLTELVEMDEVDDLGGYDAYVVGSGIYLGNWLTEARRFIDAHALSSLSDRRGSLPAAPSSGTHPSPTTRALFAPGSSSGWSRRRMRASTSSSPASSTCARSASWRRPPCAERTRATATTATGTRSSAGRPRSPLSSAPSEPARQQGGDRHARRAT